MSRDSATILLDLAALVAFVAALASNDPGYLYAGGFLGIAACLTLLLGPADLRIDAWQRNHRRH